MKIEMINENQIKCTLTNEDLRERKISLGELAYGSDKAKKLFSELVQRANEQYGFESGDGIPLMIEAIPSQQNLVMIITKVDNPDEMDPRFSRFTPGGSVPEDEELMENEPIFSDKKLEKVESPKDMLLGDILKELRNIREDIDAGNVIPEKGLHRVKTYKFNNPYRSFRFESLEKAAEFASAIEDELVTPRADLFKDVRNRTYYLVLFLGNVKAEIFNRICNTGCEFGTAIKGDNLGYYTEYYKKIAKGDALKKLGALREG